MRPEPLSGVGRLLRLLRARAFACPGNVRVRGSQRDFYASAVLMLGIHPDCLRSEPRL